MLVKDPGGGRDMVCTKQATVAVQWMEGLTFFPWLFKITTKLCKIFNLPATTYASPGRWFVSDIL